MNHFVNFGKAKSALPLFVVLAAGTTAALVACSSSDEPQVFDTPAQEKDSGSNVATLPDGNAPNADPDADVDAEAPIADAGPDVFDAAPRTCSDDNFCYSTVPAGENLRGIWGDGQGVVWSVSTIGDVLRWDGNAWNVHASGLGSLTAISGTSPTDVWVVNAAGAVYHGTGASPTTLTFAPVTFPGDATLLIKNVWGTSPTDVWAVGGKQATNYPYVAAGRVLHFDGTLDVDNVPVWTPDPDLGALPIMYTGVWASPAGAVFAVGTSTYTSTSGSYLGTNKTGAIVRRAPGAATWTSESITIPVSGTIPTHAAPFLAVSGNKDGSVWLVGYAAFGNGRFRWLGTTADNGQTYSWARSSQYTWDPIPTGAWGVAANDAWAVGPYGYMQHWDGTAWEQAAVMNTSAPLAKTFYAVWGTSSSDFWAVGDELAIHKTTANKP